jgi:hypothetical protein
MSIKITERVKKNFLDRVVKTSGCWEWIGSKNKTGYAQLSVNRKTEKASRVSYEMFNGPIPKGNYACHTCDNRGCVNPEHLFLGTQKDNMRDMVAKGRSHKPKGEINGRSKLEVNQVIEIRTLFSNKQASLKELAARFNISTTAVRYIIIKRTWKHL